MLSPRPRALVVEDDRLIRVLVARSLAKQRIDCDQAEDGEAAAKKLELSPYDIVVTDLLMPRRHGHTLCRSLLASAERPLVVVITGINEPRLTRDLTSRGVDAIFKKPLDYGTLGGQVRALWEARRARQTPPVPPERDRALLQDRGNPSSASAKPRSVAVFMESRHRAEHLAAELSSDAVDVFVPQTTDALCRVVDRRQIDVILIEDVAYGFLTGAEILARIQDVPVPTQAVVVGDPDAFRSEQIQTLNIRRVFDRAVGDIDLVQSVRSALADCERGAGISAEARMLVRTHGSPVQSPEVLVRLSEYLSMAPGEIPIPRLSKEIMADPATTVELLRLVNGSSLGLRRQITEIWEAVNLLGPARAVMLLVAAGSRNLQRGLLPKMPAELCAWYELRTVLIASVSSVFAERYLDLSADTAFVLGLIQEMGILVLANAYGDRYLRLVDRARSVGPLRLHALEQQHFHVHHAEVSAALVERWRLPEKLIQPILRHHDLSAAGRDRNDSTAYLKPMRIGEAFADLWDNRHPTRKDAIAQLLVECRRDGSPDFNESLAEAVRKAAEVAQLYFLPHPNAATAEAICTEIVTSCQSDTAAATRAE